MIICLFLSVIQEDESDYEKYRKIKVYDVPSINKSDLHSEFSEKAFRLVDEFIRKTSNLDYEIVIFFDYLTGKIIKYGIGNNNAIKIEYEDDEFNDKHITSIHNHTKDMYTPPSYKNFGIFLRNFEEYELIAGPNGLWILKGKLTSKKLNFELNIIFKILV